MKNDNIEDRTALGRAIEVPRVFPDDDASRYIRRRRERDPVFAKEFAEGYEDFMIGAMLASARQKAGLTQGELARKVHTTRSAICRWERQPSNMRLGTLQKLATSMGLHLQIKLV